MDNSPLYYQMDTSPLSTTGLAEWCTPQLSSLANPPQPNQLTPRSLWTMIPIRPSPPANRPLTTELGGDSTQRCHLGPLTTSKLSASFCNSLLYSFRRRNGYFMLRRKRVKERSLLLSVRSSPDRAGESRPWYLSKNSLKCMEGNSGKNY